MTSLASRILSQFLAWTTKTPPYRTPKFLTSLLELGLGPSNTVVTMHQGVKALAAARVLKVKLSLNWTGPNKALGIASCPFFGRHPGRLSPRGSSAWISPRLCLVQMHSAESPWRAATLHAKPYDTDDNKQISFAGGTDVVRSRQLHQ